MLTFKKFFVCIYFFPITVDIQHYFIFVLDDGIADRHPYNLQSDPDNSGTHVAQSYENIIDYIPYAILYVPMRCPLLKVIFKKHLLIIVLCLFCFQQNIDVFSILILLYFIKLLVSSLTTAKILCILNRMNFEF